MKIVNVVAAIIVKNNLIFITQRGYGEFKDGWEFPGGKIEENETPENALKREIKEELNADIEVDNFLMNIDYDYPSFHLHMKVYFCHLLKPHIELLEHENALWVKKEQLKDINFLPADKLIIKNILNLKI